MSKTIVILHFFLFQITMAQSSQDLLNELDCSLCLESFTMPKVLPCGHTFCYECLCKYFKSLGKKYNYRFPCPLCKADTIIPLKKIENFPNNYVAMNMIDNLKRTQRNESSQCDICEENALTASFCKKCDSSLCKICTINHQKFMSDHELYNIKALNEECKAKGVERLKQLNHWHTDLTAKVDHLVNVAIQIPTDCRDLKEKICKHAQRLTQIIDQSKKRLIAKVNDFHEQKKNPVHKAIDTVSTQIAEMERFQTFINSIEASQDIKVNARRLRDIEDFMSACEESFVQTNQLPNVSLACQPSTEVMTSFQDEYLGKLREGES